MYRQQPHTLTLIQSQTDIDKIPQNVHQLLPYRARVFNHFKRAIRAQQSLNRPHEQHAHHHYRKDGNRIPRHVHYEQIHRHLLQGR